jgi:SH3-like domain-containing protein
MRHPGFLLLLLVILKCPFGSAQAVCAKNYISLRAGPGTRHPVSWKVARNMPFLKLESKNGWNKVQDLEGEVHWARSGDLTTKTRCVVVKANVASLRMKPSMTASQPPELKTLDRYTPLKRLESDGEWIQVEAENGSKAWIHESNVWKPVIVNSFSF